MARPALPGKDVINSRLSPVNNRPARAVLHSASLAVCAFCFFTFCEAGALRAQPQAIEEAVQRLAKRAAALPHERRVSLAWSNHGAVSEQRGEELKALFVAQLEASQIHVTQGEAAPALRLSLEQTPSRIVISASVPAEGATSVVMEEIGRAAVAPGERRAEGVRLERESVWQSETKVLSAAVRGGAAGEVRKLVILAEQAVQTFGGEQGSWKLLFSKGVPGMRAAQRGARGQLVLAEENARRVGILLPGRRCEASLEDESPVTCADGSVEWPAGRLLTSAACGAQTWLLKSDATDWTTEDRLLLRNVTAGKNSAPVAELSVPGPVQSISAGTDAGSASVVVRNLSSGNYEVYRVVLSCGN